MLLNSIMAPLRRGGRKQYKARKQMRRGRKVSGMRAKYADTHSFKFQAVDTSIVNVLSPGGSGATPKANGSCFIGPTYLANNNRYWFAGSFAFNMIQTLQWNQVNTLFDRYKINGIKIKVIPQNNVNDPYNTSVLPVMRMVYDYDDNGVPAVGDVWSRRGVERRLDKPFSVYLKPKTLGLIFTGTGQTPGNAPQTAGFLDCANGQVPHFGIKFGIKDWVAQSAIVNNLVLRFEITYYVTLKNQIQIGRSLTEIDPEVPVENVEEPEPCENQVE